MGWLRAFGFFLLASLVFETGCGFASAINPSSTPAVTPSSFGFAVPNPAPTLPSEVDAYSPPYIETVTTGPQIAEILRTAGADETFTVSGDKFINGTTKFDIFSQTSSSDWTLQTVAPILASAQTASVTVPSDFHPWSMYLVWPNNQGVRGKPFALNRTEGWWIGPERAVAGETISIYGRNLAKDNGTSTSFVYIKPANASGQWLTPTQVNPYKVDVVVPALEAGEYEVWVHNGHGGEFGWSGPLTLTVLAQSPWAGLDSNTFDVTSYGALGDGVTDDGAAIEAAINAAGANAPATVYFPAGTYSVERTFTIPSNVRLLGDGRDASLLKLAVPLSTVAGNSFVRLNSGNVIENIEINAEGMVDAWPYSMMFTYSDDLKMINSRLNGKGASVIIEFSDGSYNLVFENMEIIGPGFFMGASNQVFIRNSDFLMTDDGNSAVAVWGGRDVSITDSHFRNHNESLSDGHGIGRIFVGQGHRGSVRNTYFSGNETHNFAPRDCNFVDCNMGEQILMEFGSGEYLEGAQSVGPNTVTFSSVVVDPSAFPGGKDIIVVAGKGLGQKRRVVSINAGVVTIDRPWDVLPNDSSSRFLISSIADKSVIYENTFQGRDTHSTHDSASTAVNVFGNSFDVVIDKNDVSKMRHGFMIVTHTSSAGAKTSPLYFTLVSNNEIYDGNNGIYSGHVYGYDAPLTYGALGNVFRRNTITNMSNMGIAMDQWNSTGTYIDSHVFERNTVVNVPYGLISGLQVIWALNGNFLTAPPNGTRLIGIVLRENHFERGTAPFSGSLGFRSEPFNTWVNQGSTWTGFETGNPWLL